MDVRKLQFEDIEVSDRLRDLDQARLDVLAMSMRQIGQIAPIEVVLQDGPRPYRLVSGAHRLAAAQRANLRAIDAVVTGAATEADLRVREIDENLARADLSDYDRANFIAERARLWQAQRGPIKRGRPKTGTNSSDLFAADTCRRFNLHPKELQRAKARFSRTLPELWAALKGTPAAYNGSMLDAVRRLDMNQQRRLLGLLTPIRDLPEVRFKEKFRAALAEARGQVARAAERTPQQLADRLLVQFEMLPAEAQEIFRRSIRKGRAERDAG